MTFLTEIVAATDRPAGLGATLALPFLDAMLPAFSLRGAGGREAGASVPGVLRAERHGDGVLDAEGRGDARSSCRRSWSRWRRSGIRCWCCRASRRAGTTSTPARRDRF